MGRKGSFADKVRQELLREEGREITALDIADRLDLGYGDKYTRRLYTALRDLVSQGEAERIRPGVYRSIRRKGKKPELQKVMWRFLRVRRTVTVEDLQEISGAARDYALEWLRMLKRQGVVQVSGKNGARKYRLVVDTVDMPRNEEKRSRLKRIRQAKRETLAALTAARLAVERAETFVKNMEVGDGD